MAKNLEDTILKQRESAKRAKERAKKAEERLRITQLEYSVERFKKFVRAFDELSNDFDGKSISMNFTNDDGSTYSKKCIKVDDAKSLINNFISQYVPDDILGKKANKKSGTEKSNN